MKRYWVWLAGFAFFLLEGTVWEWIIPANWQSYIYVVPHFVLVLAIYAAIYSGRHFALLFGLIFGFLQDLIYYGHALGVYSFAMGLSAYSAGLLFNRLSHSLFTGMAIVTISNVLYDTIVFGLYRYFLRVADIQMEWFIMHQLLPSLLLNLLFALAIYVPARKILQSMAVYPVPDEDA